MNRKAKDEAAERELKRRCKVLLDGISEAAMREIELLGHYDMPVFQFRDAATLQPLACDAQTLALMAATRDGERGLVQTLLKLRAMAREDSNP